MRFSSILKNKEGRLILAQSWSLGWPMALIMFFEFLIGLTDVYVAGKFGKEVQAGYGLAFQIYFIFIIVGIALAVGAVSVISRLFTSSESDNFHKAVSTSLITAVVTGGAFSLLGVLFAKTLIGYLSVPEAVKEFAVPLLGIYSFAFIFDYILITTNGILRACKMIKKSLLVMTLVCALNVALDFILAFWTPFGFRGIAIATVISLCAGTLVSAAYIRQFVKKIFDFSFAILKKTIQIGWPVCVLQILWNASLLVLFTILGALPRYNVETIAAFTNGLRVESAIFLPAFAFNLAAAVIVGNFLGEKKNEHAFRGGLVTAGLGVGVVSLITIAVMLNARRIAAFLSGNDIVVAESVKYIYISLLSEPIMAWGVILSGALNGAGDTKSVMLRVGVSVWLIRIPLSFILGVHFGLGATAIWWSMNISICVQAILISWRYISKKWITLSVTENIA